MCQELTVLTASDQNAAQQRRVGILGSRMIDDRPLMEILMSLAYRTKNPLKQQDYVFNNVLISQSLFAEIQIAGSLFP